MEKSTQGLLTLGLFVLATSGCGSAGSSAAGAADTTGTAGPASAQRAIVEADIIQLDSGRLYALSASGSVSVIDVSSPGQLTLLGQTRLAGQPFEMYRRGDLLVTMWNGAFQGDGSPAAPFVAPADAPYTQPPALDATAGAGIVILDTKDPTAITRVASFAVAGEIADSRIVGDVLYLATYQNPQCWGCGATPSTLVTTFNLQDPKTLRQVDQAAFASNAPDSFNLPWGSNWKRSILVTQDRLYIGGHADIDPNLDWTKDYSLQEGLIDVLDVTDATGILQKGAHLKVAGALLSRWQLDETNGVLRVISQRGAGRTGNGLDMPKVETFSIVNTQSFVPLGQTSLNLPEPEGLRTVRFDQDRAYAITYNQTDPLFTIDLSNPVAPTVRGQLKMPGFMFYLEPYGDRVIGLGVDRTDPQGSLNVSLFDVSNLDHPQLLNRVPFGPPAVGEDYEILNYDLPEDQDRIQKAFHVFPDGLVAVPFTSTASIYYGSGDACDSLTSGVQLVDWSQDSLSKRVLLPVRGNPHRAFENNGEMVTVSDSNVRSFALPAKNIALQTADLVIGTCVPRGLPDTTYYGEGGDYGGDYQGGSFGCSATGTGAVPPLGTLTGALLALLAIVRATSRRRA